MQSSTAIIPTAKTPVMRKTPENMRVCARYVGCLTIEKGPFATRGPSTLPDNSGTPIIPQRPKSRAVQIWRSVPEMSRTHPMIEHQERKGDCKLEEKGSVPVNQKSERQPGKYGKQVGCQPGLSEKINGNVNGNPEKRNNRPEHKRHYCEKIVHSK